MTNAEHTVSTEGVYTAILIRQHLEFDFSQMSSELIVVTFLNYSLRFMTNLQVLIKLYEHLCKRS